MLEVIGRFHPVVVHLPIGLLIIAVMMEGISFLPSFDFLKKLVGLTLIAGIVGSMLSLLTGHLLSLEGQHPQDATNTHKWIAFATTISFVLYYMLREFIARSKGVKMTVLILLSIMIFSTGHFGGNLTHGEEYLTQIPADKISMIGPADPAIVSDLEKIGWVISALGKEDNHVRVTGYNVVVPMKEALKALSKIENHVVELKLTHTATKDDDLDPIGAFKQLSKLWLDNTAITDAAVSKLISCKKIQFINVAFTNMGKSGIMSLLQMPALNTVYVPDAKWNETEWQTLVKKNSGIRLHVGIDTMTRVITDTLFDKNPL